MTRAIMRTRHAELMQCNPVRHTTSCPNLRRLTVPHAPPTQQNCFQLCNDGTHTHFGTQYSYQVRKHPLNMYAYRPRRENAMQVVCHQTNVLRMLFIVLTPEQESPRCGSCWTCAWNAVVTRALIVPTTGTACSTIWGLADYVPQTSVLIKSAESISVANGMLIAPLHA